MLTSCGKSAGLVNIDKKAGNKTPVASPSPKPQLQKNNETVNETSANDTNIKNDNYFVSNSLVCTAFLLISVIVVAFFWNSYHPDGLPVYAIILRWF
jgi:hypothetical protein